MLRIFFYCNKKHPLRSASRFRFLPQQEQKHENARGHPGKASGVFLLWDARLPKRRRKLKPSGYLSVS